MLKAFLPFAALFAAASLQAQDSTPPADLPALSLEEQTSLRCGVAFAITAGYQEGGDKRALAYPDVDDRGREYFVRAMAKIMEVHEIDREKLRALIARELSQFSQQEDEFPAVEEILPACLSLLEASGL